MSTDPVKQGIELIGIPCSVGDGFALQRLLRQREIGAYAHVWMTAVLVLFVQSFLATDDHANRTKFFGYIHISADPGVVCLID